MNPFPHLKLRKKLGVGFGGLILLIGLNAVIVIITIFITSRHVDTQLETADLLSELGLTEEVLTGVAVEACSHLAAQSAVRDYVESRIRARLSAFYARP